MKNRPSKRILVTSTPSELVVKKSLFHALAFAVTSEGDAMDVLAREKQPSASHHCWAWRLGERYRSCDDHEPGGTAGRPILQAIDWQAFDQIMVIVIRWFGGVKLGSGGLIRAYGGVTHTLLRQAQAKALVAETTFQIRVDFAFFSRVRSRCAAREVKISNTIFTPDGVSFNITVLDDRADLICAEISDITRGTVFISKPETNGFASSCHN